MKKTFFLIGLTVAMFSISLRTTAQTINTDSLKAVYERETIMLEGNSGKYLKNYQEKKIGMFGKKLNQEFDNSSPEAKQEMGTYMKNMKRTGIFVTSAVVIVVGAIVVITVAPEIAVAPVLVILGAGLISDSIGLVNLIKAQTHLHKGVWLRNRDVLMKKLKAQR